MSGYGLAALGTGFAAGLEAGNRVRVSREAAEIAKDENKRKQEAHDRGIADQDQIRALSETIAQKSQEYILGKQGQTPVMGVQGPPGPDGMAPTAPPVQGAAPKTNLLTEVKDAQAHFANMAPLYAKLYTLVDPKQGAKFAESLADVTTQNKLAQEAAVGRLFIKDPTSNDTRDAVADLYATHPDGMEIDRATWKPTDKPGQVTFDTVNHTTGERKTGQMMDVQQAKAMLMMGLSLPQVVTAVQHDEQAANTAAHNKVVEKHYADQATRDQERLKWDEKRYGLQAADAAAARADRRAARDDANEIKRETLARGKRDELAKGIDPYVMGDPKLFSDLPPEEQSKRIGIRTDVLNLVEMNPDAFGGSGASVSARALGTINSLMSGRAQIGSKPDEPGIAYVKSGSAVLRLPANSYVVQFLAGQESKKGVK